MNQNRTEEKLTTNAGQMCYGLASTGEIAMGYTLTIGELEVSVDDEVIWLGAEGVRLDEAPAFNEPTDHTNSRWPSYTAWADFCRDAGIEPLFYGSGWQTNGASRYGECPEGFHRERPLLAEHPGAFPITEKDAAYVDAALAALQRAPPQGRGGVSARP